MKAWKMFLLNDCTHHQAESSLCDDCVEKAINDVFDTLIKEIGRFDAVIICEGRNETAEDKLVNEYIKGTLKGYQDARDQILAFIKDLHPKRMQ